MKGYSIKLTLAFGLGYAMNSIIFSDFFRKHEKLFHNPDLYKRYIDWKTKPSVKKSIILENGQTIQICQGNIAQDKVDCIVNPANSLLNHGGGVARAIKLKGGKEEDGKFSIQKESDDYIRKHGPLSVSDVAVTGCGEMSCQHVFHVVGPIYRNQTSDENALEKSIQKVLEEAETRNMKSVSMPAISTGIFGFPKEKGIRIIVDTTKRFLDENPNSNLKLVRFVNIDEKTTKIFQKFF